MRNFDAVSSIILSNIKGEAVALAIRQRLRETPHQEQERQLPKIISDTYTSIGRDRLGAKPKNWKYRVPPTRRDTPDRRSERGGHQDRHPEYVNEKKDSQQSTIKKEEKTPQQKPQFEKKKVAALTVKNASKIENTVEEQDVGSDSVRQCGRSHNMSPESERSSGCDSN
ncbi:hypothetical protein NDU88_003010 [Pleurodeles waltl]|uniref:Uncharacterized protein n=1 Tax=Pleurodeles waltl TaxID=8319 RepID=A0AAV7M5P4_PLEWA|nr:hypothetical protein NDU88_003010 [Pleurodeles waltl]